MEIHIDTGSGFCFGVHRAISLAEEALAGRNEIFCLGEMVHNSIQVQKLEEKGLHTVSIIDFPNLEGKTVFLRAHGEPPSTYLKAEGAGIHLIDATCPIVLKLQQKIKLAWDQGKYNQVQIVIFGEATHAEVIGLNGIVDNQAIIVYSDHDILKIDATKPVELFSQTTMDATAYRDIAFKIENYLLDAGNTEFIFNRSVCSQVSGRIPQLKQFAVQNDVILFVSGSNSSNGKYLFSECQKANPRSYFIGSATDIDFNWLENVENVGITGATSTPSWLINQVADFLKSSKK